MRGFNVIFSNQDLGIDLGANGVTVNDPDAANDADTGPDGLQNFPDLVSAVGTNMPTRPGNTITIQYSLQTNADANGIVVDFYKSTACNPGAPASPPLGGFHPDRQQDGQHGCRRELPGKRSGHGGLRSIRSAGIRHHGDGDRPERHVRVLAMRHGRGG